MANASRTCVGLCAALLAFAHEVPAEAPRQNGTERTNAESMRAFAPGQVLIGIRDGIGLEKVLRDTGLGFKSYRRVHSIRPAVAKYKKLLKKEPGGGGYWFKGARYDDLAKIDDGEVFKEALKSMTAREKALYRDYKVTMGNDVDVQQVVARLRQSPDVEYAQPNFLNQLHAVPLPSVPYVPNDTYVGDDLNPGYWRQGSWGQDYPDLWGLWKIQAVEAWNEFISPALGPGRDVIVAVVDTGVWRDHADLASNIFHNENDPAGDADSDGNPDDDGNGFIDDTNGWDFSGDELVDDPSLVAPDNDPSDQVGHGTHCAGTIAAVGNNGTGLIGVAPNVRILPVKIFPNAYDDVAAQAIRYAASFATGGTRVVLSDSWGPGSRAASKPVIEKAIDAAVDEHGCVAVFSAGNSDDDVAYYSPANYSKTIAVAASDRNDQRSIWNAQTHSASNYGVLIDVSAPGGGDPVWGAQGLNAVKDILSTMSDDSDRAQAYPELRVAPHYYRLAGTSMACPHVAGLAALIWSGNPTLSNTDVRNIICISSDDVGPPGKDEDSGWGRINAHKAMVQQPVPIIEIVDVSPHRVLSPDVGGPFSLTVKITNKWSDATDVNVSLTISDARFRVDRGSHDFGHLAGGETKSNTDDPFTVTVLAEITDRETLSLAFRITAGGGHEWSQSVDLLLIPGTIYADPFVSLGSFWHCFLMNRAIGDLDGDGTNELVASAGHPANSWVGGPLNAFDLFVFNNDGSVREGWPVHIELADADIYEAGAHPALSDLDGDGTLEVIVSVRPSSMAWNLNRRSQLHVYRRDGSPYPGWPVELGSPGDEIYIEMAPVVADLDRHPNGRKEIVVNVFRADPDNWEVFQAECYAFGHDGTVLPGWPYVFEGTVGGDDQRNFTIPAVGNVDHDVYSEIITASKSGKVHIIGRDGRLKRLIDTHGDSSRYRIPYITLANLDLDGQDEIVVHFGGSQVYAYNGDGSLMPGWPVSTDGTETFEHVVLGDLNEDGIVEVVGVTCPSAIDNKYKIYMFEPDGSRLRTSFEVPGYGYSIPLPLIGDVNADGSSDIVYSVRDEVLEDLSKVYAVDSQGGMIAGFPKVFAHFFPYGSCPTLRDFDKDGTLDLIVNFLGTLENARVGGTIYVVPLGRQVVPLQWPMFQHDNEHTGRYTISVPGDFDGDGDVDLEDYGHFQACLTGPVQEPSAGCEDARLDRDGDVDRDDLHVFLGCLSGAHVPGDPDCAN